MVTCRKEPVSNGFDDMKDGFGSTMSGFQNPASPCAAPSTSTKTEVRVPIGRTPDNKSRETLSPSSGKNLEKVCEACHITLNKTPIYGDNGSICHGGARIGTPAMTIRGCLEGDFEIIAEFML